MQGVPLQPIDYTAALDEVRQWLSCKHVSECFDTLVDAGYDDLDSLSRCNDTELAELLALFPSPAQRTALEQLVRVLRRTGIEGFRMQRAEFQRALEAEERKLVPASRRTARYSVAVPRAVVAARSAAASAVTAAAAARPGTGLHRSNTINGATSEHTIPLSQFNVQLKAAQAAAAAAAAVAAAATAAPASPSQSTGELSAHRDNPTLSFDMATWDGAIKFQAYILARQAFANAFHEDLPPADEFQAQLLAGRSDTELRKLQHVIAELHTGAPFKKLVRVGHVKRLLSLTPRCDLLLWSDSEGMVRGGMPAADMQAVHLGFGDKNSNRLFVVSSSRSLELLTRDAAEAQQWKRNLDILIELSVAEGEARAALLAFPGTDDRLVRVRFAHSRVLNAGAVFHKDKANLSGVTTRALWSPAVADRLHWGDMTTRKVLGTVMMDEMVDIRADETNACKFTVVALKRTLVLEATSKPVAAQWIRALRFFVDFKQQQALQTA